MAFRSRHGSPASRFLDIRGSEPEAFVVGVLTIILALVCVHAYLPPAVLQSIGVAAFAAVLVLGARYVRASTGSRRNGVLLPGLVAVLAIIWIAAGRIYLLEF